MADKMTELVGVTTRPPVGGEAQTAGAILEGLAVQARMFSAGAAMNLLQLGRVLCEARPMIGHGDWEGWVRENAHMPIRSAQQYMQAYRKFGIDPEISRLGASHIIRLLPMSDEEREQLLRDNDVENMTDRQLRDAIRRQREQLRGEVIEDVRAEVAAEMQTEHEREIEDLVRQRDAALAELDEAAAAQAEPDQAMVEELSEARESADHFAELARRAAADKAQALNDLRALRAEYDEQSELLKEQQEMINQTQDEIYSLKSAQARGDVQRGAAGDELTAEALNDAVRDFVGLTARMPYMQATFAGMDQAGKRAYEECLRVIEGWLEGARAALSCCAVEGVLVHG